MATTLVLNPLTPPPGTCIPGNAADLLAFSAQYLQIVQRSATSTTTSVVIGSSTPDVSDQDKPWVRTTADGIPLGEYLFYNGKWVRTAPYPVGTIMNYNGPASAFDGTGKGIAGTATDAWFLCNGSNGAPDLRNRFVAGGASYTSGWITSVDSQNLNSQTGGRDRITIQNSNLPQLTADFAAATDTGNSTQAFVRGNKPDGGAHITDTITNGANDPIFPIPPFYALAFMMWNPYA
jgi:hypothetical protein